MKPTSTFASILALLLLCLCPGFASAQGFLYEELAKASYPSEATASTLTNPWGERLTVLREIPEDFGTRVATAAEVYNQQDIRFDGYLGSDDDGSHYYAAADGLDAASYGDEASKTYRFRKNGVVDDLSERVWVCLDYPIHALSLAGFPVREAMAADFVVNESDYTLGGGFPENHPRDHRFFRRVRNLPLYFENQQFYSEDRITQEQYRDPEFRPAVPFQVGDIVFFGHYGDNDTLGPWFPKHSGIVASVDERGLPVRLYNMRVSRKMVDDYDGRIDQTRTIGDKQVTFKHFSDRYSLLAHGRILYPFIPQRLEQPPPTPVPLPAAEPTPAYVQEATAVPEPALIHNSSDTAMLER